ncbi:hypothetical protein Dsin_024571 [Dipteronia sinensis]|uniref:Uncharacterized protein n=1 Tax=Dipteronia sinensis TaxID=43782 RepID=A0AAE0DWD4_9ROSI|nr:hypothetical protein Dsin_024571 [Dipteronia sinensis]
MVQITYGLLGSKHITSKALTFCRLKLLIPALGIGGNFHLRPIAHPLIQHFIGNDSSTSLRFYNWHPYGPLLSKWSPCVVYDSGLPLNATVNAIVLGDSWSWLAAMSIDLVEIRSRMLLTILTPI